MFEGKLRPLFGVFRQVDCAEGSLPDLFAKIVADTNGKSGEECSDSHADRRPRVGAGDRQDGGRGTHAVWGGGARQLGHES